MPVKKLSDADVLHIRLMKLLGYSQASIARAFEVSESAVSLIVNRKIHKKKPEK